jgi:hypothetical protein
VLHWLLYAPAGIGLLTLVVAVGVASALFVAGSLALGLAVRILRTNEREDEADSPRRPRANAR